MFFVSFILAIAGIASASASSFCSGDEVWPYFPPEPRDSRSPCPLLNTLANHKYLPHDGQNITVDIIRNALVNGINVEPGFAQSASIFMSARGVNSFNLEDLNDPNVIQHVASLTRDDYSPTNLHIYADIPRIECTLEDSPTEFLTVDSVAKSRLRYEAQSKPHNLSSLQTMASHVEGAMALMMMMDVVPDASKNPSPSAYQAPKDRMRVWLMQERFPTELGWRRSKRQIMISDLAPVVNGIIASMANKKNHTNFQ